MTDNERDTVNDLLEWQHHYPANVVVVAEALKRQEHAYSLLLRYAQMEQAGVGYSNHEMEQTRTAALEAAKEAG